MTLVQDEYKVWRMERGLPEHQDSSDVDSALLLAFSAGMVRGINYGVSSMLEQRRALSALRESVKA